MVAYNYYGSGLANVSAFGSLTNILFIFCMAGGANATFDCLSEEKREGTLGLLFLTDLKGYDIVLGKLAATSIGIICGCLAAFPVMAVLIPLGKANPTELIRTVLALANALFLSLNAGLLISTCSQKQQRARFAASMFLLLFWMGLPLASEVLRQYQFHPAFYLPLQILSPFGTYQWALGPSVGVRTNYFWSSLACTHLIAWTFLAVAAFLLPRVWQDKAYGAVGERWRERLKQWCYGKSEIRTTDRLSLLARNPILWLFGRDRLKRLWPWVFLAIVISIAVSVILLSSNPLANPGIMAAFTVFATLVLKLWVGSEASRGFSEEKSRGTLEWLFCTPLSEGEIARGQWFSLRRQFARPTAFLFIVQVAVLLFGRIAGGFNETDMFYWTFAGVGYMVTALLDIWSIGWTGMWSGLSAKNPRAASSAAALRIVVLPSAIVYLVLLSQILRSAIGGWVFQPSQGFNWGLWFVVGIVNSIIWGIWSRRQFYRRMRLAAADRFAPEPLEDRWRIWRRIKEGFKNSPVVAAQES